MRLRAWSTLILVALSIISMEKAPARADEVGFFRPERLPEGARPRSLETLVAGTVKIRSQAQEESNNCSAQFVSADGYLLTARHCIENCLKDNQVLRHQPARRLAPGFGVQETDYSRVPGTRCQLSLRGAPAIPAQLIDLGPGKLRFTRFVDDEPSLEILKEWVDKGYSEASDYAVLKIDTQEPTPCVQASRTRPEAGERIWALGYPFITLRPDGKNSNGDDQFASYGKVTCGFDDDSARKALIQGLPVEDLNSAVARLIQQSGPEVALGIVQKHWGDPKTISSTLTLNSGNSGGGSYNEAGELVALNVAKRRWRETPDIMSFKPDIPGSDILIPLAEIRSAMLNRLSEHEVDKIFSCRPLSH